MLSSVLNSNQAIQVNITIMRVFVAIRDLMEPPKTPQRRIGF
jgi:hypothetical protein